MFDEAPELYDLIYGSFKNYAAEATQVAEWITRYHPDASSLLDVACGTGEHARHLVERGFIVHGVDINPAFIDIARAKVPGATFETGDMTSLVLERKFDVVACLFSSIGYARTRDGMERTLVRLADHLDDNGVMLIEPWFAPGEWRQGQVHQESVSSGDLHVTRMGYSDVAGTVSTIRFEYLVGRTGGGIKRLSEVHELGLFTHDEMMQGFGRAGLDAVHDPVGLSGRGLYIARHRRSC